MLFAVAAQLASAAAQFPACATRRASPVEDPSRHAQPQPFIGGDLEQPGVIEAALAARAPSKELIFLSVGDTRDHRRQYKDPALRTISLDFLLNLLSNFRTLGIEHHFLLTTKKLCKQVMQGEHCQYNCAWTSLWLDALRDHPNLAEWRLKAGDMFLMWAQQWRYICRAIELGYRVLRAERLLCMHTTFVVCRSAGRAANLAPARGCWLVRANGFCVDGFGEIRARAGVCARAALATAGRAVRRGRLTAAAQAGQPGGAPHRGGAVSPADAAAAREQLRSVLPGAAGCEGMIVIGRSVCEHDAPRCNHKGRGADASAPSWLSVSAAFGR